MNKRFSWQGFLLAALTALCSGIGIAMMKAGLAAHAWFSWIFIGGLTVYGIGIVAGLVLIGAYPLSLAYPAVVGLSLAVLAFVSAFTLGETITLPRLAGITLIVLGVLLLVGKTRRLPDRHE